MNPACPDYYKMSQYEDLNTWCARKLKAANWAPHEQALLLNILWPLLLRYVIRLPFKATRAIDLVKDIDKALSLLQDVRAVFVPQAEPGRMQDDIRRTVPGIRRSTHMRPPMDVPEEPEPVQPPQATVPTRDALDPLSLVDTAHPYRWQDLFIHQQQQIIQHIRPNELWYRWAPSRGQSRVFAHTDNAVWASVAEYGGTVQQIVGIPGTPQTTPPACPHCGAPLTQDPHDAVLWHCRRCMRQGGVKWRYWQHELDATPPAHTPPACPGCGGTLRPRDPQLSPWSVGDYSCPTCPSNGRGQDGHAHWWAKEVEGHGQQNTRENAGTTGRTS